jgi:cyclophilin family peptidyl-prolyl cis-trans isomerase
LNIQFCTEHQYIFSHHHIQHVLLIWDKESRREIYIVETETPDTLSLRYPGETYRERILDELEPYFFQVLLSEDQREIPVILGATFDFQNQTVGMYYTKKNMGSTPYFFFLKDDQLIDIPEESYGQVIQQFRSTHPHML